MFRKIVASISVCAALMVCGPAAKAQLIVGEGFGYAPGTITNASGGTGWPADNNHNWFMGSGTSSSQVTSGGLTFSAGGSVLASSGNKLTTVGSDAGAFRNLPTPSGIYGGNTNQTLWIGFLVSNTSNTNQSGYAGLSLVNAYTANSVYTQTENFFIGQINGTGQYGFADKTPSNSNAAPFLTGTVSDTTTHFLVARFDFTASGTTEVSLYVDPTPGVEPTGTSQAHEVYTGSFVFNQFRLQSGAAATASYNFDELRMGSTYASVAPVAPATFSVSGAVALQNVASGSLAQPLPFTLTPTGSTTGGVMTRTLTLAASDGSFALTNIPAGTYTLGVKGGKWLRKDAAVSTMGGSVTGLTMSLLGGDCNGDNVVSLSDYLLLLNAFASVPSSANWNAAADLNCDGVVSLADYLILLNNFGKIGDP